MRTRILTGCLLLSILMAAPHAAHAQDVSLSFDLDAPPPVAIAPPPLPVYVVPPPPVDYGYIWSPGYWAWDGYDYFWVPGTWITPPVVGYLWTPGYWGWGIGAYLWHAGYWGRHVGFYGGINYGGGYDGVGFHGGQWRGGRYVIDRARLNVTIGSVGNRVSFNGGAGGLRVQATAAQIAASRAPHAAPTEQQISHIRDASADRRLEHSENHGAPPVAATARPGDFSHGFAARQAGPANRAADQYNARVTQNPATVHNAALPQTRPAAMETPRQEPQRTEPQHFEQQRVGPVPAVAPAAAPALQPQTQQRIEAPRAPQQPRVDQPHIEQQRAQPQHEAPQNKSRTDFNPGGPGPAFNPGGPGENFNPGGPAPNSNSGNGEHDGGEHGGHETERR